MLTLWCKMLSSVAGIYAILDRKTGKLYVGKANASGGADEGGIWERWECYAKNGHSENKQLIELCSFFDLAYFAKNNH